MKRLLCALLFITISFCLSAQIDIAHSRIVVDTTISSDADAARLLRRFVHEISAEQIPIIAADSKRKKGDIIIGEANRRNLDTLKKDGFAITTTDGFVRIISNSGGRGSIYGVCELLERYFSVRYWSPEACDVVKSNRMLLDTNIDIVENPAFEYRQANGYGQSDATYKMFNRLAWPAEVFAGSLWVHTFHRLMPAATYGAEHPEYYAYVRGERRIGEQSQLCLTNEAVFEIVATKLDSIFRLDPTKNIISVSQNDGDFNNCTCPDCKAIDDREESLSGSIIHFVNRLADRFPDKQISTLAYLYSVKPPKYLRPLANVNIMLCNIECTRELPLTQTDNGRKFAGYMQKWSAISDNIFMWNYGINFDNYISPFPNFHILQPNLQLFHKNNVKMVFEQVNGSKGVDFAELRGYMLKKLLWNPYCDADAIMREFVWGYYGNAAPYIYDYLKLQHGALIASGKQLKIYDAPSSHYEGMLNAPLMSEYARLFDCAEQAVANDAEHLRRVQLSRLPLQFCELEFFRTQKQKDAKLIEQRLNTFAQRSKGMGLKLNEKGNTPDTYCDSYKERYLPSTRVNLAEGAAIEWLIAPTGSYATGASERIVDGLFGGTSFSESWIGWEDSHGEFVVDMGSQKEFSSISGDFLHQTNRWIFQPVGVTYEVSDDNVAFRQFGRVERPENRSPQTSFVDYTVVATSPVTARYVRVKIESVLKCPSWHYGIGYAAWCFMDEITITK